MQSSVILPPRCRSQAVVCVSKPRMYPQSGYFLVIIISQKESKPEKYCIGFQKHLANHFTKILYQSLFGSYLYNMRVFLIWSLRRQMAWVAPALQYPYWPLKLYHIRLVGRFGNAGWNKPNKPNFRSLQVQAHLPSKLHFFNQLYYKIIASLPK